MGKPFPPKFSLLWFGETFARPKNSSVRANQTIAAAKILKT
jgi:hypothetical protein